MRALNWVNSPSGYYTRWDYTWWDRLPNEVTPFLFQLVLNMRYKLKILVFSIEI